MSLPVIIVRPQPGADATAERARELRLVVKVTPLFAIRPMEWQVPDVAAIDAVLATSANALRHGGADLAALHGLPLFAVGEATADAARVAGFAKVTAGQGDGATLVSLAAAAGHRRLLHLCGIDHRPLAHPDCTIEAVPVYQSSPIQPPPMIAGPGVLLIHSPRAGALARATVNDLSALHLVAISPAALATAGEGWASTIAAPGPTDAEMLAIAARICKQGV